MPFSINDSEIQISGKSEYNHASLKKSFEKIIRSRSRLPAIISPMNQVNSQRVFEFNSYINSPNNQENLYVELSPSERTRDEIDDRKTKLNEYKVNLAFSQAGYSPSQLISRNPFGQSQATMPKQESANSQSLLEIARRNNSNNILTYDQGDMSSVKRNKKNDDFKKFFTSE